MINCGFIWLWCAVRCLYYPCLHLSSLFKITTVGYATFCGCYYEWFLNYAELSWILCVWECVCVCAFFAQYARQWGGHIRGTLAVQPEPFVITPKRPLWPSATQRLCHRDSIISRLLMAADYSSVSNSPRDSLIVDTVSQPIRKSLCFSLPHEVKCVYGCISIPPVKVECAQCMCLSNGCLSSKSRNAKCVVRVSQRCLFG